LVFVFQQSSFGKGIEAEDEEEEDDLQSESLFSEFIEPEIYEGHLSARVTKHVFPPLTLPDYDKTFFLFGFYQF
jgi:hypothetical protein